MSLKLYSALGSPASRATILTIRALGLKDKIKFIPVDLVGQEQHSPEYIAKNPCHTVPVLEDGDFVLWDSHAINSYLVTMYGQNDSLYPKDPKKRAIVDSMNHFDTGYVYGRGLGIIRALLLEENPSNKEHLKKDMIEVFDILELILQKRRYVAGEEMTIADFSIVAPLSTMIEIFFPLNTAKYPKIAAWYEKMKALPYYNVNEKGIEIYRAVFGGLASKL